ncbi:MAG: DUF4982 domain-containing protein [Lachnospiraceae bacterium]|nr:DUF4982 domain-containing protein [Lachnospiraceae bacterium]
MDGRKEAKINDLWEFKLLREGEDFTDDGYIQVNLPHDWLIYDCDDLYGNGTGYYKKMFGIEKEQGKRYLVNFDGVYMNSVIFVNGKEVGVHRYGYSPFEFDITDYLKDINDYKEKPLEGINELKVVIQHQSPNSRWYSGAGIFRDVTFRVVNDTHIATDGVYVFSEHIEDGTRGKWKVTADIEVEGPENGAADFEFDIKHKPVSDNAGECICRDVKYSDIPESLYAETSDTVKYKRSETVILDSDSKPVSKAVGEQTRVYRTEFIIENGRVWDITSPESYELEITVKQQDRVLDTYKTGFGLRTIEYTTDNGFFLNGRHVKINGACEHHDLGLFGAAFNKDAMRRKFVMLKKMGVNAVRTSHNMPARILMELADEMGIMIDSEGFDMWRRPKTEFDYARFFEENYRQDIRAWIRRDRNHPSVIMWSIGNEIYDCHADDTAPELTLDMKKAVEESDPAGNAPVTHASNFMAWEGARNCTDVLKMAGYNYGERLYDEQHKDHPDWKIYGSETCSTVQSRGIYHFPLSTLVLADDDEQCSSLGNCTTSWGAPSTEYVLTMDRDRRYSQGQFIWTGFDYIGEPTPYHTKNSYFGQIDTAGFPKDTYYMFKGSWTDPETAPFVHIFPYWDFNEGQLIDVRVASNCDKVELYFREWTDDNTGDAFKKGKYELIGSACIDHYHGTNLTPSWQIPYRKGTIKAVAYLNEKEAAINKVRSFGDAERLVIKENYHGEDTLFFEINAVDKDGNTVENANNRVHVLVTGAGELRGLDNGDSTDNENYKCDNRRLFSGKLLAAVGTKGRYGKMKIVVTSEKLWSAEYNLYVENTGNPEDKEQVDYSDFVLHGAPSFGDNMMLKNVYGQRGHKPISKEIPIRNIKLKLVDKENGSRVFTPDRKELLIKAEICPENATYNEIKWAAVNDKAVPTNIVKLEPFSSPEGQFFKLNAQGDGEFRLRAMAYNGERVVKVISSLEFKAEGLGKAFINPYEFVSGSLYTDSKGEIGNGNEKGIATPRGEDSYFGFENVDFGELGSDEVTIPIFTLNDEEYKLGIWEGRPGEAGSTLLCDGRYKMKSIWNVYQPGTFYLNKKLKGVTNIYFTADDKYHFKGFMFKKPDKAYEKLTLNQRSRIYGDTYIEDGEAITGIGNNVTIEFDGMDFGESNAGKLIICGRSKLANNSIHLKFDGDEGVKTELLEFEGSDEYIERSFLIKGAKGTNTVGFVFLPGCDFDFKYFRFVRQ